MKIPLFRQSDSSRCGPASIRMILAYYNIDASEDEICGRCNHSYEFGCYDNDIKAAFESYGLGSRIYNNQSLDDIEYWINHNIPVIVDWFSPGLNCGPEEMPNGHASVIYDIDREKVYMLDPDINDKRAILRDDFLRVWFDWRKPLISPEEDNMVIRQLIIAYPKKLDV